MVEILNNQQGNQMTQEELQTLREQAKQAVTARTNEMKVKAEITRLNSMVSGPLGMALAKQAVVAQTSQTLVDHIQTCTDIVNSMPIYSKATREQRKFNPSKVYGFGNQVSNLLALLSGIQYSATDHKQLLLAQTGLNEDIIEQTLEAFGSPSYYSTNYSLVIDEQPYDADKALSCVEMLESILDISIDKSKLTEKTFRTQFEVARIKAETQSAQAQLATMKTIKIEA